MVKKIKQEAVVDIDRLDSLKARLIAIKENDLADVWAEAWIKMQMAKENALRAAADEKRAWEAWKAIKK